MNYPAELIALLKNLNRSSIKDRLNALCVFLLKNPDFFSEEDKKELLNYYENQRDTEVLRGQANATKRWHKSHKSEIRGENWTFIKSKFGNPCAKCSERYEIDDFIFCETVSRKGYHPECVTEEIKQDKNCVIFYQKWLKEQENKNEKE
jgi:hypothetical protein